MQGGVLQHLVAKLHSIDVRTDIRLKEVRAKGLLDRQKSSRKCNRWNIIPEVLFLRHGVTRVRNAVEL
jgi:hypothetical protein